MVYAVTPRKSRIGVTLLWALAASLGPIGFVLLFRSAYLWDRLNQATLLGGTTITLFAVALAASILRRQVNRVLVAAAATGFAGQGILLLSVQIWAQCALRGSGPCGVMLSIPAGIVVELVSLSFGWAGIGVLWGTERGDRARSPPPPDD